MRQMSMSPQSAGKVIVESLGSTGPPSKMEFGGGHLAPKFTAQF
jgi:hypothetical protein